MSETSHNNSLSTIFGDYCYFNQLACYTVILVSMIPSIDLIRVLKTNYSDYTSQQARYRSHRSVPCSFIVKLFIQLLIIINSLIYLGISIIQNQKQGVFYQQMGLNILDFFLTIQLTI